MSTPQIVFDSVSKSFGPVAAVRNISLNVERGEFFSLLGPSGCGKTTLLRMLAGFERPDSGRMLLGGVDMTVTPPHRRPVNMMFQSYALFPHMSVEKNIAFGLQQESLGSDEIRRRVKDILALVQLDGMEKRKPDQLSGGQRQRVALARALVKRPQALLLDEPLAALDKKLREETQIRLKAIQKELALTFFVVTHDQDEALTLSDRIAIMDRGAIVQVGTPQEIYRAPRNVTAAAFVGDMNLVPGTVRAVGEDGIATLDTGDGPLRVHADGTITGTATIGIRPEDVDVVAGEPQAGKNNAVAAIVQAIFFRGDSTLCVVRSAAGHEWRASWPAIEEENHAHLAVGAPVWLIFSPRDALLLADKGV